ncbi:MAG TPA: NAD(P)/FAD-dependent oxidoreductase [Anditalea sp.]|nr:NAD(P)/FAD-dependent oxidoreductase [Anditalea sp.]
MHKNIIVIGAGQYGLIASYFLKEQKQDFLVLEKNDRVGDNWRKRFESMKLFSPAKYNALPGLPIALDGDVRPTKNQMADYFDRYIDHFELPVETNVEVKSITLIDGKYAIHTYRGDFTCDIIIMANGISQHPITPEWVNKLAIPHIHISNYRNPVSVKGKKVLVVGEGNSSAQIASELVKYFEVDWARDPKKKFTSLYVLGKNVYWWNEKLSWSKNNPSSEQPIYLYDDLKGLLKRVNKKAKVEDANGSLVAFADGTSAPYDFVIYSEGYLPDYDLFQIPDFELDIDQIRNNRGISSMPRIFFIGIPYQRNCLSYDPNHAIEDVKHILEKIESTPVLK